MKCYICCVIFVHLFVAGNSQNLLYEGDVCETSTNEPGICVRLPLCESAQKMFEKKEHPVNCGFVKNTPIICCPKMESKYTYLAEKKCEIYNQPIFGIILGQDAELKEFPHMAALGYTYNNEKVWLCGGTLISEQYILTAAHCLVSSEYGSVKWVRLGLIDINQPEDKENSENQNFEVIKTIAHPLYNPPLVYNDIGLVQLDRVVQRNLFVKPACLFTQDKIPEETKLLATGWGLTKVGGNQSNILQKVLLDLFSKEECDLNYNRAKLGRKLKHGILHEQQICAGGKTIGTDTCQGDSGGPLTFKENIDHIDRSYVVGVTSFGKSCGFVNVPGVYVRVSYYLPWIESIIWPNEM